MLIGLKNNDHWDRELKWLNALPWSFLSIICRIRWSGLIQRASISWYGPTLGTVKSPGCSEYWRAASNTMQAGSNGRKGGKKAGYWWLPSHVEFKHFCTNVLSKRMGKWIIIPKTGDILPKDGGEVGLKTVSQGSATRVIKTVLSPRTNASG